MSGPSGDARLAQAHVLFDVTTGHYNRGRVMTGIPRVEMNVARCLTELMGDRVSFVRLDSRTQTPVFEAAEDVLGWESVAPEEKLRRLEKGVFARNAVLASFTNRHSGVRRLGRTVERSFRRTRRRFMRRLSGRGDVRPDLPDRTRAELQGRLGRIEAERLIFLHVGADWLAARLVDQLRAMSGRRIETRVLVHDLLPLDFPQFYPGEFHDRFQAYVEDCVEKADRVFAYSAYTSSRIAARTGHAPDDIARIRLPTDMASLIDMAPVAVDPVTARGEPFFLTVGVVSKRKNQAFLVDVWAQGLAEGHDMPLLVIAGSLLSSGEAYPLELYRRVQGDAGLRERIVFVENASDAQLVWLYRHCRAFLFPSLAEGWGLPVTEALAFGRACLTSDRTAVPEAAGSRGTPLALSPADWLSWVLSASRDRAADPDRGADAVCPGGAGSGGNDWTGFVRSFLPDLLAPQRSGD